VDARVDHGPQGRHVGVLALGRLVTLLQDAARRAAEPSRGAESARTRPRRHHL
jgi:hypothetical protein